MPDFNRAQVYRGDSRNDGLWKAPVTPTSVFETEPGTRGAINTKREPLHSCLYVHRPVRFNARPLPEALHGPALASSQTEYHAMKAMPLNPDAKRADEIINASGRPRMEIPGLYPWRRHLHRRPRYARLRTAALGERSGVMRKPPVRICWKTKVTSCRHVDVCFGRYTRKLCTQTSGVILYRPP